MRENRLLEAVLLGITLGAMLYFVGLPTSSDLRAVWLAGQFWGDGSDPARIYTGAAAFTMEPPRAWIDQTLAEGRDIAVYPFIYPPLWAWAAAQLVPLTRFDTLVPVAGLINLALLLAMPVLARRILNRPLPGWLFLLILLPLYGTSFAFLLALEENQPQILVSFLLLLAIERRQAGAPLACGAALALAASIKLYPALFALFLLFGGDRRAFAAFLTVGAALAAASVAVAGWPMHAAFLAEIRAISNAALYTTVSYSFDPFIAKFAFPEALEIITTEETGGKAFWKAVEKTPVWRLIDAAALLAVLAGLCHLARRDRLANPAFWPLAILAIGLVSPLTWVYHLTPALVFIPGLFARRGWPVVLLLYGLLVTLLRVPQLYGAAGLTIAHPGSHELTFAGFLLLTGMFLLAARAHSAATATGAAGRAARDFSAR